VATAVSPGDSPITAVLVAARVALDECRLVSMDAPDLSAFAGARAGTIGVTLQTRKHKDERQAP
jgi:hypothetical protein